MRRLLMFAVALAFTLTAQAKPTNATAFEGRLLTYKQLMGLTSKKRIVYLNRVSELLATMEQTQAKYEVADNSSMQEMKEQIAFLMRVMAVFPQAYAATDPVGQPTENVPRGSGTAWTCAGTNTAFDPSIGTCALQRRSGALGGTTLWHSQGACPDNTTAIGTARGSRKCVPLDSFNALSDDARDFITNGGTYPSGFFNREIEKTKRYTLGSNKHKSDGSPIVQTGVPTPTVPPVEPTEPAKPAPKCVAPAFKCSSLEANASADLIKQFRSRTNKDNVCVVGGFFSEYKDPKNKIAGTCKPVKKVTMRTDGKDEPCKPNDPNCHVTECKKEGEALCNPLVFCLGLVKDDKSEGVVNSMPEGPAKEKAKTALAGAGTIVGGDSKMVSISLCEKIKDKGNTDMSKRCNDSIQAHVDNKDSVFGGKANAGKFGEKYVACDASKVKGMPVQKEWDRLRKGVEDQYKTFCNNEKDQFTALFCKECGIIAERIMAFNDEATGTPCAPVADPGGAPQGAPEAVQ